VTLCWLLERTDLQRLACGSRSRADLALPFVVDSASQAIKGREASR
jgi:hypothetical protein